MIFIVMCGGMAKGLATSGGAVSPSLRKKKLSKGLIELTNLITSCYE